MNWSRPHPTALVLLLLLALAGGPTLSRAQFKGPWNMAKLKRTPKAEWGAKANLTQEVYYESEPYHGKPTRVFAYLGRPTNHSVGKFPALLLVHGGGGQAFAKWAQMWAERGYVALAMDTAGYGAGKAPLPDGGPDQTEENKFRLFTEANVNDMWTYHAVAAVVRGHSLLGSLPEVDARRIGVTGISWGGYVTCIVAGVDDRLKCAVPVYGSGFLWEDSTWLEEFERLGPAEAKHWCDNFDPSNYLPGVRCPILFVNSPTDLHYRLAVHQKSRRLVPGRHDLHMDIKLAHSHPAGWAPTEIALFTDSIFRDGKPLARVGELERRGDTVRASFKTSVPIARGELCFTTNSGPYEVRKWQSVPAQISGNEVQAALPKDRPLTYFLNVIDERGALTSSPHEEIEAR